MVAESGIMEWEREEASGFALFPAAVNVLFFSFCVVFFTENEWDETVVLQVKQCLDWVCMYL